MPIGGGFLARFYRPGGGAFELFLSGVEEFAHQKNCRGDGQAWN